MRIRISGNTGLIRKMLSVVIVYVMVVHTGSAMQKSIGTATVGNVTLTCDHPEGWRFELGQQAADGLSVVSIDMTADRPLPPPAFRVRFRIPLGEADYLWNARDDGRCQLRPDWLGQYESSIASGIPLYTLLNDNNGNCLTVAVAEPFRRVVADIGIVEKGAYVGAEFSFFTHPEAPMENYHTEILFDDRRTFYAAAIADATQWIVGRCGIKPAPVPDAAFDPLYSSWYNFHQSINSEDIGAESRIAAGLGMKNLILDDGWQTSDTNGGYYYCGDWEVSPDKFPDMAAHVAKVQAEGLKYMLWYSVPFVGPGSKNHDRFRHMYLTDRNDRNVLDPRFPEVREFLCSTYENALKKWNLDGFKLDFIDQFVLGDHDPAAADCYAGRDIKSLSEAVDTLMKEIRRRLQAVRPEILIEFRQNYIGPAIRQYGNMLRANDCPGDAPGNRRRIASLRLTSGNTAVHSDMLEWNVDDTAEEAARHVLSALFGVVQYSMRLKELPPDHLRMMKHWIDFSRIHRNTLLRSDFRPYYPQEGYPLIEAESDDEMIIATYSGGNIVTVKDIDKPVYILNVTGAESIPLELSRTPVRATVVDTFGNAREAEILPSEGMNRVNVPCCGYLLLEFATAIPAEDKRQVVMSLGEERVIVQGMRPEEHLWGPYQFPRPYNLGDRLLVAVHVENDDIESYGAENRWFESRDKGCTWKEVPPIVEAECGLLLSNGERLYFPPQSGIDVSSYKMTPIEYYTPDYDFSARSAPGTLPVPDGITYWMWNTEIRAYDADRLPDPLCRRDWVALRTPADGSTAVADTVSVDWPKLTRVVHSHDGKHIMKGVFPRGNLKTGPDGAIWVSAFSGEGHINPENGRYSPYYSAELFRSDDMGRTFHQRGHMEYPADGNYYPYLSGGFSDSDFEWMPDGSMVWFFRSNWFASTGEEWSPMYMSRSTDMGGTWSRPVRFSRLGTLPRLCRLNCGTTLLCYARPGTFVQASLDDSGTSWSEPLEVMTAGDRSSLGNVTVSGNPTFHQWVGSCNNPELIAVDDTTALIFYTDFYYPDSSGIKRKTVLCREIKVKIQ